MERQAVYKTNVWATDAAGAVGRPGKARAIGNRAVAKRAYSFELTAKVKPYVRMTRRGMWVKPEAMEYLDSKAELARQLALQMAPLGGLLGRSPLGVEILFCCADGFHHKDLDNMVKAVLDAANKIVYADDRWIDSIIANRIAASDGCDRTIFKVWEE